MVDCLAIYGDPSMLTNDWQPNQPTTWHNAPAGRYVFFAVTPGTGVKTISFTPTYGTAVSDIIVIPSAGPGRARTDCLGTPVGTLDIGGSRDGTIGPGTFAYTGAIDDNVTMFRVPGSAPDVSLTVIDQVAVGGVEAIYVEDPSLDLPRGGVFALTDDGTVSVQQYVRHWGYPVFTPPWTVFWIVEDPFADFDVDIALLFQFYDRYLNNVPPAEVVG